MAVSHLPIDPGSCHTFETIAEARPGPRWQGLFERLWPAYRAWFTSEGVKERPRYLSCVRALKRHMPELLPTYEALVDLAGGGDTAARFLSLYCPPAYLSGCSQALWPGHPPLLVRNYDYSPALFEGVMFKSAWGGREVLAMTDCLWGVLDGLNGAKLCVSLTFGGRRVVGEGFGIPLILRYVLETCATAREGVAALCRIPSHMAYNVTLVDGNGDHYTVHVGPDRSAAVGRDLVTTNHQREVEWQQHARATATLERERFLKFRLAESDSGEDLARAFLRSPLYSIDYQRGFGTLYTAVYRPFETSVELLWPNASWRQSLAHFTEERRTVRFPRGAL